ncbi:MAG: PAS domain S-box protein [Deltaproteobacteria bacterium]|nr:PAS domain S-box protein [Deltaproteobacteria bacterium]
MMMTAAFEATASALTILDREHRVVAMNAAARRATRGVIGRELAVGEDILTASAVGAHVGFLAAFARALAGETVRHERRLTYPGGARHEFHVEYVPLRDDAGAITHVLFGAIDIHRQVEVEDELALLRAALAQSPVVLLIADARQVDLPIVYASDNLARETGYPPAEVLGRNARLFQGRFGDDVALDEVRQALGDHVPCEVVLRNERKDGSMFWNRLTLAPVRDAAGTVTHVLGVQQDVTAQQELARRLREIETLEASTRAAAAIAHDFNNMLTIIGCQVGVAQGELLADSAGAEALAVVVATVGRAAGVLRRLLAQPERAGGPATAVGVAATFATVRRLLARTAPAAIALELEPPADNLAVRIDSGAFEQALINLALNAIDAMPGGGALRMSAMVDLAAPDRVVITVADTGTGMAPEVQARIFEPLFTTKARDRASGLGLASVAATVADAGGAIGCDSAPGQGTRFRITLPRA